MLQTQCIWLAVKRCKECDEGRIPPPPPPPSVSPFPPKKKTDKQKRGAINLNLLMSKEKEKNKNKQKKEGSQTKRVTTAFSQLHWCSHFHISQLTPKKIHLRLNVVHVFVWFRFYMYIRGQEGGVGFLFVCLFFLLFIFFFLWISLAIRDLASNNCKELWGFGKGMVEVEWRYHPQNWREGNTTL